MRTEPDVRKARVAIAVEALPSSVRRYLLADDTFCAKFDIIPRFSFPLGDCTVETRSLNKALRAAIAGRRWTRLSPERGPAFRVKLGVRNGGQVTFEFKGRGFAFDDADLLSSELKTRSNALSRVFAARPIAPVEENAWRKIARQRDFTDREYLDLMTALEATPESLSRRLQTRQELEVGSLMPEEPKYYERLLAPLRNAPDFPTFIGASLAESRRLGLKRHPKPTLRRVAFAALWQPLIPFDLLVPSLKLGDVEPLIQAEDPFSLLFAFELCCRLFQADSGFVRLGARVLQKLFEPGASKRRCHIFSALALVSMTTFRRVAKASTAPLYWVRLAALTQAGVLTDALGNIEDDEAFFRWSAERFYASYRWQGIVDRRDAPKWNPEWISPDHLQAELLGRARIALYTLPEQDRPVPWLSAIETALGPLAETGRVLATLFPGPFDDFKEDSNASPEPMAIFGDTEAQLEDAAYFNEVSGLVPFAYLNRLPQRTLANVLRILNRPIEEPVTNDDQDLTFLHLCAYVAGVARSEAIATAVINRCLHAARSAASGERVAELFLIVVEACAAHADPAKHRELLGTTATQLCFAVKDNERLSHLEPAFDVLAVRDEKFIPTIARARAIVRTRLKAS
jgi:hypothetical protein